MADTKLEFGLVGGQLLVCDEVLRPGSSRFWEADSWEPGGEPVSFDKQPVRDYYESIGWNKQPPAPPLPEDVIAGTQQRYQEAVRRITAV